VDNKVYGALQRSTFLTTTTNVTGLLQTGPVVADVDLAGHGGGDKGRAMFAEQMRSATPQMKLTISE